MVLLAIDGPLGVDVEQITPAATVGFRVGYFFSGVFNDKCTFGNGGRSEEAKSGPCA